MERKTSWVFQKQRGHRYRPGYHFCARFDVLVTGSSSVSADFLGVFGIFIVIIVFVIIFIAGAFIGDRLEGVLKK